MDSPMNTNISPKSLTVITDDKITSTQAERAPKRAASDQSEGEVKKVMSGRHSCEERLPSVVPKSFVQPKFISATEMAANTCRSVQIMPEISDEELLEMAIKFEMEHPE